MSNKVISNVIGSSWLKLFNNGITVNNNINMITRKLFAINNIKLFFNINNHNTSLSRTFHSTRYKFSNNNSIIDSTIKSSQLKENSNNSIISNHHSDSNTNQVESVARSEQPKLHATFTCVKCSTRSTRSINKKAYTSGVVLVRCEGCKKLHLFADHLGWFSDNRQTIEDIMNEKGMKVKVINKFRLAGTQTTDSSDDNATVWTNKNNERYISNRPQTQQLIENDGTIEYDPTNNTDLPKSQN